jgi:hypothetical protein
MDGQLELQKIVKLVDETDKRWQGSSHSANFRQIAG